MTAPSQETAKGWIGQPVHDTYGNVVGTCAAVVADDRVGVVEWLDVQRPEGERSLVPADAATKEAGFVRVAVAAHAVVGAPTTSREHPDEHERARLHAHYGTVAPPPLRQPSPDAAPSASASPSTLTSRVLPSLGAAAAAGIGVLLAAALAAKVLRGLRGGAPASVGSRRRQTSRPTPSRRPRRSLQERSSRSSAAGVGHAAAGLAAAAGARAAGVRTAAASTGREAVRTGARAVRTGADLGSRAQRAVTPSRRRSARMVAHAFVAGRRSATVSQRWRGGAVSAATAVAAPVTAAVTTVTSLWRISVGIIKNALVFGGGYVVGSRAGRERYQQLKQQGSALLEQPRVQQALQRAKGAVTGRASTAVDRVKGVGSSGESGGDASKPSPTPSAAPTEGSAAPTTSTPDPSAASTEAGISDAELDALTTPDGAPSGATPPTTRSSSPRPSPKG